MKYDLEIMKEPAGPPASEAINKKAEEKTKGQFSKAHTKKREKKEKKKAILEYASHDLSSSSY